MVERPLPAGCSLTSGCPSLKRVEDVLTAMPAQQRGDLSAEFRLSPEETKRQLTPLFEGTSPNLGYYCLASLGRRCKTLVLNLNWDDMVERAADALRVAYLSYDIADDPTDIASAWDELDAGLLVLHIHGKLDGSVRHTRNQTLHITREQQSLIDEVLLADRLISVGASLRYDHDVNAMLRNADAPDPGYYFNRADDEADAADHSTRTMDTGHLFERPLVPLVLATLRQGRRQRVPGWVVQTLAGRDRRLHYCRDALPDPLGRFALRVPDRPRRSQHIAAADLIHPHVPEHG